VSQKVKQIQLSWTAASDNTAVSGYSVWKDGAVVAMPTGTNWIDTTFTAGATYTYFVIAYDEAGNGSAPSNTVAVTLSGGGKRR